MDNGAIFGISVLMSFAAFGLVTKIFIWPNIRGKPLEEALVVLIIPHTFRFVGLSFLVVGVVSPQLAAAFASPAAYGDMVAALLAGASVLGLLTRATWRIPAVWLFNLWGTADLLYAIYQGEIGVRIDPGSLGATFFIPTVVVPPLMILHVLVFKLLLSGRSRA